MKPSEVIEVTVLTIPGCPNAMPTLDSTRACLERLDIPYRLEHREITTETEARAMGFLGSPSVCINGSDLEGKRTNHGALSCRVYGRGQGAPPDWLIEAALLRTLRPRGFLFLCVANSARSQMAEGIARALAPADVRVWSAGSRPARVRPEAIKVLQEIGVDISHHHSKHVAEIPAQDVEVVITLCAEEECPVFLGKALRIHWGLPDPAAEVGSEEQRLDAFRKVRDELQRRLGLVFGHG